MNISIRQFVNAAVVEVNSASFVGPVGFCIETLRIEMLNDSSQQLSDHREVTDMRSQSHAVPALLLFGSERQPSPAGHSKQIRHATRRRLPATFCSFFSMQDSGGGLEGMPRQKTDSREQRE